jgi:AP-4 complex subunit mu-1
LRKNSILTYELLDEMLDYGYAQSTSTESLKVHVFNEPATPASDGAGHSLGSGKAAGGKKSRGTYGVFSSAIAAAAGAAGGGGGSGGVKRDAVQRSVLATGKDGAGAGARNEIFVDVVEKLNVTFNSSGHLLTSEVDGSIQIRNFLHGTPQIRLALPEDLAIGGRDLSPYGGDYSFGGAGAVLLDDCNFHESADLKDFDTDRTIVLTPPEAGRRPAVLDLRFRL